MNMTFRFTPSLIILVAILSQIHIAPVGAEPIPSVSLSIQPEQCVSMREGLDCYAKVTVSWQSSDNADYCLYSDQSQQALQCWQGKHSGDFYREVVSNKDVRFFMTKQQEILELASTEMRVSWVYKRKRSPVSWRVF